MNSKRVGRFHKLAGSKFQTDGVVTHANGFEIAFRDFESFCLKDWRMYEV